jgi:SAM-dependent methyltransferase
VFPQVFGKNLWQYFKEDNPAAGQRFNRAMSSQSQQYNQIIARTYDFSSAQTVVDVGGGQGSLLATLLHAYPKLRGILFDQPSVIEQVNQGGFLSGLENRATLESGNFFEQVPAGADIYILKQIIHDWRDPECIQILSNCRKALKEGGRVLVIDELVDPEHQTLLAALVDLQLLITLDSYKRTQEAHLPLFAAAGLRFTQAFHMPTGYSILEAVAIREQDRGEALSLRGG